jgi:hypothetical protein
MSGRDGVAFPDRARFMGYAARVMRRLVIDHVRRRQAAKRGGMFELTALDTTVAEPADNAQQLERLSDALDELATVDAVSAEVVDLKFFCGFTFAEIAGMRGLSERTVQRQWEKRASTCTARSARRPRSPEGPAPRRCLSIRRAGRCSVPISTKRSTCLQRHGEGGSRAFAGRTLPWPPTCRPCSTKAPR